MKIRNTICICGSGCVCGRCKSIGTRVRLLISFKLPTNRCHSIVKPSNCINANVFHSNFQSKEVIQANDMQNNLVLWWSQHSDRSDHAEVYRLICLFAHCCSSLSLSLSLSLFLSFFRACKYCVFTACWWSLIHLSWSRDGSARQMHKCAL